MFGWSEHCFGSTDTECVYEEAFSREFVVFLLSVATFIPVPHSSFISFFFRVSLKRKLGRQRQIVLLC